eukprot:403351292
MSGNNNQAITFSFSFGTTSNDLDTNQSQDTNQKQSQISLSKTSINSINDAVFQKPAPQKASIFQKQQDIEDEMMEDELLPQKKQSQIRTGYANVTKASEQIGRNTSDMAVKQHKKHQVVDAYFTSKLEQIEKTEREKELQKMFDNEQLVNRVIQALSQSKEQEQQMLENYSIKCKEHDNLIHMMNQTKKKVKICYVCNRMFASAEHLKKHEKESQMHKENDEKLKIAQNTLLL